MRTTCALGLALVLSLLGGGWGRSATAPPGPAGSIACTANGRYIGGINRDYSLVIGSPPKRNWRYVFRMEPGPVTTYRGTYELTDGLAVFTGTAERPGADPFRFGVNHGAPGGEVRFQGFFRDRSGKLVYHRRWYRRAGKGWQPSKEWRVALPGDVPAGKEWRPELVAQFTVWDEAGRPRRETLREVVHFRRMAREAVLERVPGGRDWWLLHRLLVRRDKAGKATALVVAGEGGPSGVMRGFHPSLAEPVPQPSKGR